MKRPTQHGRPVFTGRIEGTMEAVRSHLIAVEVAAAERHIEEARRADMLIVLGEVLNNIVEHALSDAPEGWIDCAVSLVERDLSIETCDNGAPLPPTLVSSAALPDVGAEVETLPEGGWGWFIVHSLTDDMTYERRDGMNRLCFSLKGNPAAFPATDLRTPRGVSAR
ncbi:ATP-binding protein [Jannaschia formosa]|uniref:ATP-binding protein n=1 Tax=Jannaschia formosa TaxID=2259592 RepID=UPI000E1B78A9|nr:ATP-binding protein [Jannaschia formosa]TFL18973.1 ATP-binding protein [Jannaschia formosa]